MDSEEGSRPRQVSEAGLGQVRLSLCQPGEDGGLVVMLRGDYGTPGGAQMLLDALKARGVEATFPRDEACFPPAFCG